MSKRIRELELSIVQLQASLRAAGASQTEAWAQRDREMARCDELLKIFGNYVNSALAITATIDPNVQRAFDLNAWRALEDLMQSAKKQLAEVIERAKASP